MKSFPGETLEESEKVFWEKLIEDHLKPLTDDNEQRAKVYTELTGLRNKVFLIFILINFVFIIVVFGLQQVSLSGERL